MIINALGFQNLNELFRILKFCSLKNKLSSSLLFSVLRTLAQFIASEDIKGKLYLSRRFQKKGSKVRQETIFLHSEARRSSARAQTHTYRQTRVSYLVERTEFTLLVTVSTDDQGVMRISFATARSNLLILAAGIM